MREISAVDECHGLGRQWCGHGYPPWRFEGLPKKSRSQTEAQGFLSGGLDELMAVPRRSRWEPTLAVFPNQLRVGDRFTDAEGEWEVASRPVGFKQGHEVRARVRRPGAPGLRHGARIGAEALRDQAADFVELDALADRLQRGQGDDRASHAGGV